MAGFDNPDEYPVLNPGYSIDVQWTYTVANIVESGVVVGGAGAGPSNSANSSRTAGVTTPTRTGDSATPGLGPSTMPIITTNNSPSSTRDGERVRTTNSPSAAMVNINITCENFADPDNGVANECQFTSGNVYTKLPMLTGLSDLCGYTSFLLPSPTPTPTSNSNPYPFTYTDLEYGPIIACKSSSIGNAGVPYTVCDGDRTTVGTDPAIYDHYTSAEAAAASASAASAATAMPTGDCAFWDETLFWTFEVYNINGWAGNDGDGLHKQESGCGDLTGWSWTISDPGNDQHAYFNLPFFMKYGCVERAIASAGGPSGLSCSGNSVGKTRRYLKLESEQRNPIRKRRFRTDVSSFPQIVVY